MFWDYLIVAVSALFVAGLTLFSGFGLGSLLLPVVALFFSLEIAVAATAVIHLANNLFKLVLVARYANWPVVLRFGAPAVPGAFSGAVLLGLVSHHAPIAQYPWGGRSHNITWLGILMGALIIGFAIVELVPFFDRLRLASRFLPFGGFLSGLFGGISGHQGALRSAFLVQSGLSKEAFIGTGVVCAVLVDLARLGVYGAWALKGDLAALADEKAVRLLATATVAAFLGSFLGARLMHHVTLTGVQRLVGVLLLVLGVAIAIGLV
jgi:uncharacterized membrane protein YfcA